MEFFGTFKYTVDMKGRICIPPEYREEIGAEFVCRVEHRPVFHIHCMSKSQLAEERARYTASYDKYKSLTDIKMDFCSTVFNVKVDTQGRVMFPQEARERAEIGENVYVIGSGESFRIMSDTNYNLYCASTDREMAEIDAALDSYRRNNIRKMAGLSADEKSLMDRYDDSQRSDMRTVQAPQPDMNTMMNFMMNMFAAMSGQGMNGGFNNGFMGNPAGFNGNNGTPNGGGSR